MMIAGQNIRKVRYLGTLSVGVAKMSVRKVIGRDRYKVRHYNGQRILFGDEGNRFIAEGLRSGKPFMAARFGDTELRTAVCYMNKRMGLHHTYPDYIRKAACVCTGVFPNTDEILDRFSECLLESCQQVDAMAVWFNLLEDYAYRVFGPKSGRCISLDSLEAFWYEQPWTKELAGKKVLVIHPFAESIEQQYARRDKLYQNKDILPDFELKTLKAVQSLSGGDSIPYADWFEALEWMYEEAMKIDFDVAILGCGGYGLPLGAKLKKAGKSAIHMGGVTQFLFGIRGNRWDERPRYAAFYNEYWCRPGENERPQNADKVENACYW